MVDADICPMLLPNTGHLWLLLSSIPNGRHRRVFMWFVPSDYETLGIDKKRDIKENKSFPILRLFQGLDMKKSVATKKPRNKLWSKQEIKTLRRLYPHSTKHELIRSLNRTHHSIANMARILGLHKEFDDKFRPYRAIERRLWSDEENRILKKMYPSHTAEEISPLIDRTSTAIIAQANKLKLKKRWLWTNQQCDYLRRFYQKKSCTELAQKFGRTVAAVEARALELGIADTRGVAWTKRHVKMLIKYRPTMSLKELAKRTGHPVKAVEAKALGLGIKRYPDRNWTEGEDRTLKKYYARMTQKKLADKLGRSFYSVINRLCALGLTDGSLWTKKDIAVLKKEYKKGARVDEIANLLGKKNVTCYYKIKTLGLRRS